MVDAWAGCRGLKKNECSAALPSFTHFQGTQIFTQWDWHQEGSFPCWAGRALESWSNQVCLQMSKPDGQAQDITVSSWLVGARTEPLCTVFLLLYMCLASPKSSYDPTSLNTQNLSCSAGWEIGRHTDKGISRTVFDKNGSWMVSSSLWSHQNVPLLLAMITLFGRIFIVLGLIQKTLKYS